MNEARSPWKRLVIGLAPGLADRAGIDTAVQLAEALNIDLLATFIADASVPALAAMPGLRELRALEQEWQLLDPARLSRDIEHAIDFARRRFAESVGGHTIKTGFDVLSGAESIRSIVGLGDILAVIEPAHPAERIARQFTGLLEVAFEVAGAILFIPRRITQKTGPIVTDALSSKHPEIRIALEIAAAWKERLIVVDSSDAGLPTELPAQAKRLGIEIGRVTVDVPWADESPLVTSTSRSIAANRGCYARTARPRVPRRHRPCRGTPALPYAQSQHAGRCPRQNGQDRRQSPRSQTSRVR
jgi:hypothetical protein